jgi:POT family proton-dependent oligopeptide transporter
VASVWWLVLAYGVLELGELSISPIGLSAVTQLSVPRVVSVMMGAWFLATAYSEVLAAKFGELTAMDVAEGETLDVVVAAARYGDLFMMMFWLARTFHQGSGIYIIAGKTVWVIVRRSIAPAMV